jgi:hypothetical protein
MQRLAMLASVDAVHGLNFFTACSNDRYNCNIRPNKDESAKLAKRPRCQIGIG